jgi:hypothetical protein
LYVKSEISLSEVRQVIDKGVSERLWRRDFSPSTSLDFEHYVFNRLKNEKKSIQRKILLADTDGRLQTYITDAISVSEKGDEYLYLKSCNPGKVVIFFVVIEAN